MVERMRSSRMEPTMKEFPRPLRRPLFFYQMASSGATREAATVMIEPVGTHQRHMGTLRWDLYK